MIAVAARSAFTSESRDFSVSRGVGMGFLYLKARGEWRFALRAGVTGERRYGAEALGLCSGNA
jgi:hypothetical protein